MRKKPKKLFGLKKLACPSCGKSEFFTKTLNRSDAPALPGLIIPCPDCLEFAVGTEDQTFRKATAQERRSVMADPQQRAAMEGFAEQAREFKRLREQVEQR